MFLRFTLNNFPGKSSSEREATVSAFIGSGSRPVDFSAPRAGQLTVLPIVRRFRTFPPSPRSGQVRPKAVVRREGVRFDPPSQQSVGRIMEQSGGRISTARLNQLRIPSFQSWAEIWCV